MATVITTRPFPNILLVTLNRPKHRNTVGEDLIPLFCQIINAASIDTSVRAIIVTGNPDGRAFCAGADLSPETGAFGVHKDPSKKRTVPDVANFRDGGGYSTLAALRCTKPIIAAINGAAVGWGLAITLACDIRIAAENAKVGFTMVARGLVNESCSSWLLPRIVGPGKANELIMTGRVFLARDSAKEAPGLFNYVLPENQVVRKALDIAQEISTNASGMAVSTCKFMMQEGWDTTVEESMLMESEALHHVTFLKSKDLKEGITSFIEKREPSWVYNSFDDLPRFVRVGLGNRKKVTPNSKL
jgi:enoyl-CoA hydratase/carnithine racemase